jgi:hypothetical protein
VSCCLIAFAVSTIEASPRPMLLFHRQGDSLCMIRCSVFSYVYSVSIRNAKPYIQSWSQSREKVLLLKSTYNSILHGIHMFKLLTTIQPTNFHKTSPVCHLIVTHVLFLSVY